MSTAVTDAPASANAIADARPIPLPAPVTKATFPVKSMVGMLVIVVLSVLQVSNLMPAPSAVRSALPHGFRNFEQRALALLRHTLERMQENQHARLHRECTPTKRKILIAWDSLYRVT